MIRVLHVVTHMNRGGLETMIMNYYRNIDRETVQFDFLVHRENKADYDEEIEQLGGRIYRISRLNPFSISYRKELNNFFKEHSEYQIVHVHQDCMSSIILKAAKKNGVKVRIAHSHSSSQDKNIKYLIKLFYKRLIPQYATDLLACGEKAGKWMFSGAKFQILNNAIEADRYVFNPKKREYMRESLGIKENELLIGHVGRFSPPKNHEFLIQIFNNIVEKKNAKLLLIGDGDLRKEIENKVKQLGISDRVIFTGVRSDVFDLMQAMDVFVFPSLYEGLPVTMVEAQAAGLPCVISSNIPKETVIIPGLVDIVDLSDSFDNWGQHICQMVKTNRKDTSDKIIENGFDIKESAKWLEEFYCKKSNVIEGDKMKIYEMIKNIVKRLNGEVLTSTLVSRGLIVGKNFNRQQGCYIDPSHCFLIEIGDNVTFSIRVTVLAHDASTKKITGYTRIGKVKIGDNVFVGANATILPNVIIGNNVIIGANSVVTKSVPENSIIAGNPARIISQVSEFRCKNIEQMQSAKKFDKEYRYSSKISEEKIEEMKRAVQEGIAYID